MMSVSQDRDSGGGDAEPVTPGAGEDTIAGARNVEWGGRF